MLDRAAPRRRAHEPDQAEGLQLADVVADVAQGHVKLGRELARARRLLFEKTQNLDAQRMREGLDYSLVGKVGKRLHRGLLARSRFSDHIVSRPPGQRTNRIDCPHRS
jgi:hypothetical protein